MRHVRMQRQPGGGADGGVKIKEERLLLHCEVFKEAPHPEEASSIQKRRLLFFVQCGEETSCRC